MFADVFVRVGHLCSSLIREGIKSFLSLLLSAASMEKFAVLPISVSGTVFEKSIGRKKEGSKRKRGIRDGGEQNVGTTQHTKIGEAKRKQKEVEREEKEK